MTMGSGHSVVVYSPKTGISLRWLMNSRMFRVLPTIGCGLCMTTSRDHGINAILHVVVSTRGSDARHLLPERVVG